VWNLSSTQSGGRKGLQVPQERPTRAPSSASLDSPFVYGVNASMESLAHQGREGLPNDRGRCYYGVTCSDKAGWNEMNWNKLEQLAKCTIRKVGEGMAQVFNNLSHPP